MLNLSRPGCPSIPDVTHLGPRGALYLLALLESKETGDRVTPIDAGTRDVLRLLDALGVISDDPAATPVTYYTPWDTHPWRYTWHHIPLLGLTDALRTQIRSFASDRIHGPTWLQHWHELIAMEVKAYLFHLLRSHHFDDRLAGVLDPHFKANSNTYSLGQWRYAVWAAIRAMSSVAVRHPRNFELLEDALHTHLPKRLAIARNSHDGSLCFSRSRGMPDSTLSRVFTTIATDLGDRYWQYPPSLAEICRPSQAMDPTDHQSDPRT
jgi:hypothetical protein